MEQTTFIISDGLADIVTLIKKNIYDEAAARWCVAAMALPYDFTDLELLTLRTYVDRSPKGIK
jgi:uncharacterized protein YycO